jgi:hypothetical protein
LDSSAFSRVGHAHDGRYYSEAESDARFVRQSDLVMPVAAYSGGGDAVHVGSADAIVETVSLTAPAAGVVIVSSTTAVEEPTAYDLVACSITTGTEIDHTHRQDWESPGRPGYLWQMTGTRGFPVAAGAVFTANLVCRQSGNSPTTSFTDAVMTAIFIPNG